MSNYAEYICKGAHCKCMEKDCTKFHNGDHTCPSSTPMTPQHDRDELDRLIEQWIIIEKKDPLYIREAKMQARRDFRAAIDTHVAAIEREADMKARIDELQRLPRAGFIGSSGIRFDAVLHSQIDNRIAQLRTTQEADAHTP